MLLVISTSLLVHLGPAKHWNYGGQVLQQNLSAEAELHSVLPFHGKPKLGKGFPNQVFAVRHVFIKNPNLQNDNKLIMNAYGLNVKLEHSKVGTTNCCSGGNAPQFSPRFGLLRLEFETVSGGPVNSNDFTVCGNAMGGGFTKIDYSVRDRNADPFDFPSIWVALEVIARDIVNFHMKPWPQIRQHYFVGFVRRVGCGNCSLVGFVSGYSIMAQRFLLSAASRTLSLRSIYKAGEDAAYATFCEMRWPETNGEAVCPQCGHDETYNITTRRKFKCKACAH